MHGESYYYDWSFDTPFTTNPKEVGCLTHGLHNHLFVDGVEATRDTLGCPVRFMTGPNGWAELEKNGERKVVQGNVRYENDNCVRDTTTAHNETWRTKEPLL